MTGLRDEAKAKITWGESGAAVERFLRQQGCSRDEARRIVGELVRERRTELRGKAWRDLVLGAALLSGGILFVIFIDEDEHAVAVAIGLGLWRFVGALLTLLFGTHD